MKLVPIRIANSLVLAQNSSGEKLVDNLVSQQNQTKEDGLPDTGSEGTPPGGGSPPSRGPCENMDESLTALLPREAVQTKVLISQENTKLWFYNPYERESINSVLLRWENETEPEKLSKPAKPGFVSVSLPSKVLPLKDGNQYNFRLTVNVYCSKGPNAIARPDSVPIKIQLQKFNLPQSITALQRANIYAQKGYSFDALTQLALLKEKNPNNPNWNELLKSMNLMGFKTMETKPIVDCCTPKSQKP